MSAWAVQPNEYRHASQYGHDCCHDGHRHRQERVPRHRLRPGGAIVVRQRGTRGQIETRLANMPARLIGMEACVSAHRVPYEDHGTIGTSSAPRRPRGFQPLARDQTQVMVAGIGPAIGTSCIAGHLRTAGQPARRKPGACRRLRSRCRASGRSLFAGTVFPDESADADNEGDEAGRYCRDDDDEPKRRSRASIPALTRADYGV
jgi:hypothetical protein